MLVFFFNRLRRSCSKEREKKQERRKEKRRKKICATSGTLKKLNFVSGLWQDLFGRITRKFLLKKKLCVTLAVKRIPSVRNSPHSLPLIQPVISFDRLYCAARRPLFPFSLSKPECNYLRRPNGVVYVSSDARKIAKWKKTKAHRPFLKRILAVCNNFS